MNKKLLILLSVIIFSAAAVMANYPPMASPQPKPVPADAALYKNLPPSEYDNLRTTRPPRGERPLRPDRPDRPDRPAKPGDPSRPVTPVSPLAPAGLPR